MDNWKDNCPGSTEYEQGTIAHINYHLHLQHSLANLLPASTLKSFLFFLTTLFSLTFSHGKSLFVPRFCPTRDFKNVRSTECRIRLSLPFFATLHRTVRRIFDYKFDSNKFLRLLICLINLSIDVSRCKLKNNVPLEIGFLNIRL